MKQNKKGKIMKTIVLLLIVAISFGAVSGISGAVPGTSADFYITTVTPQVFQPDTTAVLNFTLKNLAPNYAIYTKLILNPGDVPPIYPVGAPKKYTGKFTEGKESEQYFGAILQNEEVNISYKIHINSGTKDGVYYVPLLIEWKNKNLNSMSQTINIALRVRGKINLGISDIATIPAEIRSGHNNVEIAVNLVNTGESEVRNLRTKLLLKEPFTPSFSGSDVVFLGTLQSNSIGKAEFHVDINKRAEAKTYTVPLELTYEDSAGNNYTKEKNVEILIEPRPYFNLVSIETMPQTVVPGGNVVLKIKVNNTGGEKAEYADIRVIREFSQPFDFSIESGYIGTMKPGKEGEAAIKFTVSKDAIPISYRLRLSLRYTGNSETGDNNVYTQEITVPVTVKGEIAEHHNMKIYAGIAGVIVLLAFVYVMKKKNWQA